MAVTQVEMGGMPTKKPCQLCLLSDELQPHKVQTQKPLQRVTKSNLSGRAGVSNRVISGRGRRLGTSVEGRPTLQRRADLGWMIHNPALEVSMAYAVATQTWGGGYADFGWIAAVPAQTWGGRCADLG